MNNQSIMNLKSKANQFILQYQQQQTQRQHQKQRLKQNIMLEILSNKNKSSGEQSQISQPYKQMLSREQIKQKYQNNSKQIGSYSEEREISGKYRDQGKKMRNKSETQEIQDDGIMGAQITFKANPSNRSSYILIQGQSEQELSGNYQDHHQELSNCSSNNNAYDTVKGQKDENQMTFRDQAQAKKQRLSQIQQKQTTRSQKFKFPQPQIQPDSDDNQVEESHKYQSYGYERDDRNNLGQQQQVEEDYESENRQDQKTGGVFLTVEEDQSIEATQQIQNKNYAFDIVMDKSQPIDNMDQLRKRKIQEMDKKRQMRLSEHKRNEQNKKSEIPMNKAPRISGYSQKKNQSQNKSQNISQTKISEDPEPEAMVPRQKNRPYQKKQNITNNSIQQQSYYQMKKSAQTSANRGSYLIHEDKQSINYQVIKTPKTILSENRKSKSRGKNTIFKESPQRTEKSASKYSQQPKIQPKDRKNTFVKQSNRKLMINAVSHACLPGELNRKERQRLIEVIENQSAQFFVFLFKEYSRKVIKAIYTLDHSQTTLHKIYGEKAPLEIISENVKAFYRFDSGSRQFKKLDGCKSFSLAIHAIDLIR